MISYQLNIGRSQNLNKLAMYYLSHENKRSLLYLLRQGGYILYARHGEATVGEDQPNLNFQYCFTQRNLSEVGRRQAIYYGEILRNLCIPINYPIITSPFCRTRETAELAFGKENVQVDPYWANIYKLNEDIPASDQKKILASLKSILELQPPLGCNKVIIGHSFPKGIGLGQIPNMGTIVIKPQGKDNGYKIVDKLSLADLANLLT